MIEHIKQRLQELYEQKSQIDEEIAYLENRLNANKKLTKEDKIQIFRSLFIGRFDIYAKYWENSDKTKKAFFPVTKTFQKDDFIPLDDNAIEAHLRGNIFLATYPICYKNKTKFIVLEVPLESKEVFEKLFLNMNIEASYEKNSLNELSIWIFFDDLVEARFARELAGLILQRANCGGRIFPNQDFSNNSNLGASVKLPLHLLYRNDNKTVFIDKNNQIYKDQWLYLKSAKKNTKEIIEKYVDTSKKEDTPWENKEESILEFPNSKVQITLFDSLFIKTENLSKSLINHLKELASFENPQVKTLLRLRKPLYNIPRVIKSFDENDTYLILPRGLKATILELFEENSVEFEIEDKRFFKEEEFSTIKFTLREEQSEAIEAITKEDFCICVAPPGFGKTLIGAKMVEVRNSSTLVVVNKNMLLDQWRDRFVNYFEMDKKEIGFLGKGKNKLNGKLDVATMQSLKNSPDIVKNYSQIIVDECHHIPAVTFEQIIKNFSGKYVLGLSATPNRKDGLEPILFQQLGSVAYEYKKKNIINHKLRVINTTFTSDSDNYSQLLTDLCIDKKRNELILKHIKENINRKILVLTDRIEHITKLEELLKSEELDFISVHGSQSKKEKEKNINLVEESSLILATTSFFGEGIDFPHLNTIIFATPISYYGRLIQYLGRIGRNNQECLAIDFLDSKNAMLNSAYRKRREGYKQMHYIQDFII